MKAGDRFYAGLGFATVLPEMDFETRSAAGNVWDGARGRWTPMRGAKKRGLSGCAAFAYAQHPTTDAQLLAFDLKDGLGPERWAYGMPPPQRLIAHLQAGGLIEAHNVMFERLIWHFVAHKRYGWPDVPAAQWRCSMAKARAFALPGALGDIGSALNLPLQKDKAGKALIELFSMPRQPTIADSSYWNEPEKFPDLWSDYVGYNVTDIQAEQEVSIRCPDLEGEEFEYWQVDQAVNWRGVQIDLDGVHDCIAIIDLAHAAYNVELHQLTSGEVEAASQLQRLKAWLQTRGVEMGSGKGSMDEEAIAEKLKDPRVPPDAKRALEIRQAVGSASVKKVFSMANQVSSRGRLHGLFNYHGARTGRPTGEGPQPTNLPRSGPNVYQCRACAKHSATASTCEWCGLPRPPGARTVEWCVEAVEDALEVLKLRDLHEAERIFGDAMAAVSGSLRGLFVAAPFHDLIASDFTAIEAVVLAELAGEEWRLEVFRKRLDIYLMSASKITGTPMQVYLDYKAETGMHHPHRQDVGKVAELASGYGGWIGAWRQFGAEGDDQSIKEQILAWRDASINIVDFWGGQTRDFGRSSELFGLEGAAIQALLARGERFPVYRKNGTLSGISYEYRDDVLFCTLPSGRHLSYHRPRLTQTGTWRGYSISFEGFNTNPKTGPRGWIRMQTYSGKLAENVTQAVARDIQRHAGVNLERAGYPIVLHVYDENVAEVPQGFGSIEEFEAIMSTMPDWAKGWPVSANGGWRGRRYRKA